MRGQTEKQHPVEESSVGRVLWRPFLSEPKFSLLKLEEVVGEVEKITGFG